MAGPLGSTCPTVTPFNLLNSPEGGDQDPVSQRRKLMLEEAKGLA